MLGSWCVADFEQCRCLSGLCDVLWRLKYFPPPESQPSSCSEIGQNRHMLAVRVGSDKGQLHTSLPSLACGRLVSFVLLHLPGRVYATKKVDHTGEKKQRRRSILVWSQRVTGDDAKRSSKAGELRVAFARSQRHQPVRPVTSRLRPVLPASIRK